jgi:hypothetical protein
VGVKVADKNGMFGLPKKQARQCQQLTPKLPKKSQSGNARMPKSKSALNNYRPNLPKPPKADCIGEPSITNSKKASNLTHPNTIATV